MTLRVTRRGLLVGWGRRGTGRHRESGGRRE